MVIRRGTRVRRRGRWQGLWHLVRMTEPVTDEPVERAEIAAAIDRAIDAYVAERRRKLPEFVERSFSFSAALALHRRTFGRDLYKYPLNLVLAPPAVVAHGLGALAARAGAKRIGARLRGVPLGIPTALEREIRWRVHTELLELPYAEGDRASERDALLDAILAQPEITERCERYLDEIGRHAARADLRPTLERNLAEYAKTRVGVADLAGSVISLGLGAAIFDKATPGAVSAGGAAAAAIAQQVAIANFALGPALGSIYYGIFPATASAGLLVATTGALMAGVGVLTALSWIVIDPVLARTGFHQRRLDRFLTALATELHGKRGNYRVREHYLARVFDVLDVLRGAALALR